MASKDGIGNQHEIDDFLNKVDEIGNFICEQCVRLLVGLVGFLFFFFRSYFIYPNTHGGIQKSNRP